MNPPARRNPASQVSGRTQRVVVVIDGDESDEWEVVSIALSAGGGQADQCQLVRRMTDERRARNLAITESRPQWVEVWIRGDDGELAHPLFCGELDTNAVGVDAAEGRSAVAAIRPHHFGEPLRGMLVWEAVFSLPATVEFDAEFNPRVDGKIIDNMMRRQAQEAFPDHNLWYLPEATRTERAYAQHGEISPLPWFLTDAVEALSKWLNRDETRVKNYEATANDLEDAPALKNVTLKRGQYLPALLDALLPAYGYQWTIDYQEDEEPDEEEEASVPIKPRIRIYKRGEGQHRELHCTAPGEHLTLSKHGVGVDLQWDLCQLANEVRCEGSIIEREMTIELYRCWSEELDETPLGDMNKQEGGNYAQSTVWRKWAANEAGDYSGTRTEVHPIPDDPPYLSQVASANWIVRRRKAESCLTWEDEARTRRRPAFVEFSTDSGETWQPINPGWGARILQDEIGVMFTGNEPPEEIYDAGPDARLRITCTVKFDERVRAIATRNSGHPQSGVVEMVLDCSDQFHDRQRVASGPFASQLTGDADTVDDSDAIQAFAAKVRSQREAVAVQSTFAVLGIAPEYQIGDIITKINGREIELRRMPSEEGARYLQIVSITYDVPNQRTILQAMPYDTWAPSGGLYT